jgi:hypothetical protein
MFDVGASLRAPLAAARDDLNGAQAELAQAGAGKHGGRSADAAMAKTARAAIFTEALIQVERARLQELKDAAR